MQCITQRTKKVGTIDLIEMRNSYTIQVLLSTFLHKQDLVPKILVTHITLLVTISFEMIILSLRSRPFGGTAVQRNLILPWIFLLSQCKWY